MMTDRNDAVVEDYLQRVFRATAGLPDERREELVRDLREHIEAGRADLTAETEAQVRGILERLGDPILIADAAADGVPPRATPPVAPPPMPPTREREATGSYPKVLILVAVIVVAVVAFCMFFAQSSTSEHPAPAPPMTTGAAAYGDRS